MTGSSSCRSGRWPTSTGCIGGRCGRRWTTRCRRSGRPRFGWRRSWTRRSRSDRRDAARGPGRRRASSVTPPAGSWPGWSMSTLLTELTYSAVRDYVANAGRRSGPRPVRRSRTRSCRRPTSRARRLRSTSPTCGSTWQGSARRCFLFTLRLSFSRQGRPPGVLAPRGRRRSWRATQRGLRGARRDADRSDPLRQPEGRGVAGARSAATAASRPAGSRSAPTTASTRSTATPASKARTRRAASRVRAAGSAATTWSRSRKVDVAGRAQRAADWLRPRR